MHVGYAGVPHARSFQIRVVNQKPADVPGGSEEAAGAARRPSAASAYSPHRSRTRVRGFLRAGLAQKGIHGQNRIGEVGRAVAPAIVPARVSHCHRTRHSTRSGRTRE